MNKIGMSSKTVAAASTDGDPLAEQAGKRQARSSVMPPPDLARARSAMPKKDVLTKGASGHGTWEARPKARRVLVVDIGGSSVKVCASAQPGSRSFRSGRTLTPERMVAGVKQLTADWKYNVVSIGYPGPVYWGRVTIEPHNLGKGWVNFDFARAFGCPVKVINDAAMQALGSYHGGKMLFLGLGTGLGTAMIVEGIVQPMELCHLPYKRGTYEDYIGRVGLERDGEQKWRHHVEDVVRRLIAALQPDDTVIGGGNVNRLEVLPPQCRKGENANAFRGGFRLWDVDCVVPMELPPRAVRAPHAVAGASHAHRAVAP